MPEKPYYTQIQSHTEEDMEAALDSGWQEIETRYGAGEAAGFIAVHQSLEKLAYSWRIFSDDAHDHGVAFILKYLDSCKSGLSNPVAKLQGRLVDGIHITLQTLGYDINNLPEVPNVIVPGIKPKNLREI